MSKSTLPASGTTLPKPTSYLVALAGRKGKAKSNMPTEDSRTPLSLRTIRSDGVLADSPPPDFCPDLNYPPPGYHRSNRQIAIPTPEACPMDWTHRQPPTTMRIEARTPASKGEVAVRSALADNGSAIEHSPIGMSMNHSVDDMLDLIEEYLSHGDEHEGGAEFGPNPFSSSLTGANWGDRESDGTETPININLSSNNLFEATPVTQELPSRDGSPVQSLDRRSTNSAQHILPDVVATADGIRSLIMAPHVPHRPVSLLAHRIGPTLLLEGAVDGAAQLTVDEARKRALRSKLLYYSVMMSRPGTEGSSGENGNGGSSGEESSSRGPFRKALQWRLSDLNILIGSTQPTLRDRTSGSEVNLQLHELREMQHTTPSDSFQQSGKAGAHATKVGSPQPESVRIDQASALEYWLDNILSNVSSLALCFHRDGAVQGYQVVPTHNIPQLSDPAFAPMAVQASSTRVLKWLKDGTNTGGTSFVVVKDSNSTELKLYDITGLSSGHVADIIDHPDSRSRRQVTAAITSEEPRASKRVPNASEANPEAGALVPISGVRGESGAPLLPNPNPKQFGHLRYPYAMMCFRMAQCLPSTSRDAFRLWQKVATLLSVEDEESLLPLAIAHVGCMEFYRGSQLPDAERLSISQASQAVQCLFALDRSLRSILLPPSLLRDFERTDTKGNVSHQQMASLLEQAIAADPEVRAMVNEMRRLSVVVVNCMCDMAQAQLGGPNPEGSRAPYSMAAMSLGRAVENVLVAQAALLLRASEVPSGLILANPETVSISSEVSSLHHALAENAHVSSDKGEEQIITPYSQSYDVLAAFERVSTVAGDVMAGHLSQLLECATSDLANNSGAPATDTLLAKYLSKLNRDLKVTFSVMSGRTGSAPTGSAAPSIIGAEAPDHANFIGRLTPFHTKPIAAAEVALTFYQQALSHNYVLLNGAGDSFKALHRKIAGIHAIVAEFYARALMRGQATADEALEDRQSVTLNEATPWRDSEAAYIHFDKGAKAFVQCKDFANAALNFINASKMCLRASQALARQKAIRLADNQRKIKEREAAAAEDDKVIAEFHDYALAALANAERLPGVGSASPGVAVTSGSSGVPAAILDNVRQFTFSVLVYIFQWEVSKLGASKAANEAQFTVLHDQFLAPALKIPRKLAHCMPTETQRAMEAKVLKLMTGMYWMAYVAPPAADSDSLGMTMADRVTCIRFAKTRMRQFWSNYLAPSLSANAPSVPLLVWLEAADTAAKMAAADLFLFHHSTSQTEEDDKAQHVSRAITVIADWRPWLRMAETQRVRSPDSQSSATGKHPKAQGGAIAPIDQLLAPALCVAKQLTATLMCLLKMMKSGAAPDSQNVAVVATAVRNALKVSASQPPQHEVQAWLASLGACISETEKLFQGRRGK